METLFWSTMFGHSRTSICILCTLFLARCHISIWQSISQCSLQLLQLFSGFHLVILDYVSVAAVVKVDKERSATNENASVSTSFWWLIYSIWLYKLHQNNNIIINAFQRSYLMFDHLAQKLHLDLPTCSTARKQLVIRHTSSYKSVIFQSLSKTSMSETSSPNKTCSRF